MNNYSLTIDVTKQKVREIRMTGKKEDKLKLPPELQRYKRAKIFQPNARDKLFPGEASNS